MRALEQVKKAKVAKMNTQILTIDKIVNEKLKLASSSFLDAKMLTDDLSRLKAAEFNMRNLGVKT